MDAGQIMDGKDLFPLRKGVRGLLKKMKKDVVILELDVGYVLTTNCINIVLRMRNI